MSMLPTVLPARSKPTIRCMAAVDLPDPPFSLPSTITRGRWAAAAVVGAGCGAGDGAAAGTGWEVALGAESVIEFIGRILCDPPSGEQFLRVLRGLGPRSLPGA